MGIDKIYSFTIFTPTWNRRDKLNDVFLSLSKQTFHDFEWIIVDDGSTDNTNDIVNKFIESKPNFPICYFYQKNSGKHIAQNRAVDLAKGTLFLPLDSDDKITENALEILWNAWESIKDKKNFSGVSCHCMDQTGKRIGTQWPQTPFFISNDLEIFFMYHVVGEKWGAIRTDVMRQYKNASVKGHFLDESVIWFRIAENYSKLFIDECLRIYEIGNDSVQKRTIKTELINAESKLYANLAYINEFYEWFKKYDFKDLVKHSLKVVYYSALLNKKILFNNGVIKDVKYIFCKFIVVIASPYSLYLKIKRRKYSIEK